MWLRLTTVAVALAGCDAPHAQCETCSPELDAALEPPAAADTPIGIWHLAIGSGGDTMLDLLALPRTVPGITLDVRAQDAGFAGTITDRDGTRAVALAWNPATAHVTFADARDGGFEWFDVQVIDGILVGRAAPDLASAAAPTDYRRLVDHVTGWNETVVDRELAPRTYDLLVNEQQRAVLRIDRAPAGSPGAFVGRYKVHSNLALGAGHPGELCGATGEQLEDDVAIDAWDGHDLVFTRRSTTGTEVFTGVVTNNHLAGTWTKANVEGTFPWAGRRSQVLGFGISPRSEAERDAWVLRTRRQLQALLQAGAPAPLTLTVNVLHRHAPFTPGDWPPERDDDPEHHPPAYELAELEILQSIPNPYDPARPLTRRSHGWLATPTAPPPPGTRYPGAVVLDGHSGSARRLVQPDASDDSFGDWYARRGYIMLAIDISHRPVEDRHGLYPFFEDGDDPADGNGAHPAIAADGLDSDWVEDGERAYDASRALDVLLAQPNIDPDRIVITGLSMGGEVTMIAGGLDPRFAMSVPVGVPLDAAVHTFHAWPDPDRHQCWTWGWAGMREYIDWTDYLALTAPRPLIVGTGKRDLNYSSLPSGTFASAKQGVRRASAAYPAADAPRFIHDLYDLAHFYHAGDLNPTSPGAPRGLRIPRQAAPDATGGKAWQIDGSTDPGDPTLFDAIARLLAP